MLQEVDGDKVWRFSFQAFKSSIPDDGRPWNTVPELEFWAAFSTPSETCVSWDCVILVCWDYVSDWGFPSEGCG